MGKVLVEKCAVIAGATGFIGNNLLRTASQTKHFDRYLLVGHSRHIDRLIEIQKLYGSDRVRVSSYSELPELLDSTFPSSDFYVFDLSNSFIRGLEVGEFGGYLNNRLKDAQELIEPFLTRDPHMLLPLSWHSFRAKQSYYSATKRAVEEYFCALEHSGHISLCRVVLFDTYGRGDSRDKLVPRLLAMTPEERNNFVDNPTDVINLTHVDDLSNGLLLLAKKRSTGLFQIKNETDLTVGQIVEFLSQNGAAPDLSASHGYESGLPTITAPPPDGWVPQISVEAGLADLAESIWS